MPFDPALKDHQAWLGYLQPDGLVVSPAALVDLQVILPRDTIKLQEQFLGDIKESSNNEGNVYEIADFKDFARRFLEWPDECLFGLNADRPIPKTLKIALPEFGETLGPSAAFAVPKPKDAAKPWLLLIQLLPIGTDMDAPISTDSRGWQASPARKLKRLFQETRALARLLALNAQRAEEKKLAAQTTSTTISTQKATKAKKGRKKKGDEALGKILDMFSGDKK